MTTINSISMPVGYNAGTVVQSGGGSGSADVNDGYKSFGGSILRNAAVGAAAGALIALPTGLGIPLGLGIGAAVGAGSALIRSPKIAGAVGDGMKGAMAGAAGGAIVGVITPFGPVGGAVAGGIGGFLTGVTSGLLKNVAGGRFSIDSETTVWGRIKKGFALGAVSGAVVGTGAGLMFGVIGALPGALWGAAIGGIGGAIYGASTGLTDAATGAKGVTFLGGGRSGGLSSLLPHFGGSGSSGSPNQSNPGQNVTQKAA
ncbi:MAG: hypothetical protein H7287_14620 [Thermoleophilia bacterium]|nr:hypothetical protein [Thermoleophilia bacterium]